MSAKRIGQTLMDIALLQVVVAMVVVERLFSEEGQ